jgi:very-short-patch-repair endonuclease
MAKSQKTKFAQYLRRHETDAERMLWSKLRSAQLNGAKFRRQQPVGNYVVDFICFDKTLIIEVDGGQHSISPGIKHDQERTEYLENEGYRIIRFQDNDVLNNIQGVIDEILKYLD